MHLRRIALPLVSLSLALSLSAGAAPKKDKEPAADPPKQEGPRKDPKGVTGISPFWENIKRGDDAMAARDLEGARAGYQEAIRSEPQNPMGHYRMGEAELAKGNLKEAEGFWQSALRFSAEQPAIKAKVLFVLADLKERQRSLEEATNGWNAYESHATANGGVKTYPETPVDRRKRIEEWKKLETEYAVVKERIKQRLAEAEKKAAADAMSPQNR